MVLGNEAIDPQNRLDKKLLQNRVLLWRPSAWARGIESCTYRGTFCSVCNLTVHMLGSCSQLGMHSIGALIPVIESSNCSISLSGLCVLLTERSLSLVIPKWLLTSLTLLRSTSRLYSWGRKTTLSHPAVHSARNYLLPIISMQEHLSYPIFPAIWWMELLSSNNRCRQPMLQHCLCNLWYAIY